MFKFSLEPVLEFRQVTEEARQRDLNVALEAIATVEESKTQLEIKIEKSRADQHESVRRDLGRAHLFLYQQWLDWARSELPRLEERIETLTAEAEKRRVALARAAKDRMILDKLKEKELRDYRYEEDRAEQRMFDEIASREFFNRRRSAEEKVAHEAERIER